MASQKGADELFPYLIRDAREIEEGAEKEEKRQGTGAYGFVYKVKVDGIDCIAKKLHKAYVDRLRVSAEERNSIIAKFRNECIILSKLRHPNVVRFVGVHYGRADKTDITLVMESLASDLDDFLATHANAPLSLKLSILLDVSYGLVYLHEHKPSIVHRDLTARNILISVNRRAKIADLGMAKIVNLQEQLATSHTQTPGQMFYMPPEALKENASCTPKLDIFSFGHLSLYAILQKSPKVYEVTMTQSNQGIIQRLKRQKSLDQIGEDHPLYPIIIECLFDKPEHRPDTRCLNKQLCELCIQHCDSKTSNLEEMDKVKGELHEVVQQLQVIQAENDQLKENQCTNQEEIDELVKQKDELVKQKDDILKQGEEYRNELTKAQNEIQQLKLSKMKQRQRNNVELEVAIADTARLSDEVLSKTQQVNQYKKQAYGYRAQADAFKAQLQEERMKIQELEQRLHYLHKTLHNQNEEHKEEVDFVKAQCMSEKMDLERVMVPMRRELEQLRSQKMGESQYAESFKRIESEKRELQQKIAELERKNDNLMDSLTEALEVLIQKNLPLPIMSRKGPLPPQVDYAVRPYDESQQSQPLPTDSREPLLHRLKSYDYSPRQQLLSYSKTEIHNQPPSNHGGGNMQPNQAVPQFRTVWQGGGAGQQYGGLQNYPPSSPGGRKANQKPSPPMSHIPRAMEQQNRDVQGSQFNPQQQQQLECNAQVSSADVRPYQPQQPHVVPPPSQQAVASNVSCNSVTQDSQGPAANLPQENVLIHGIDSDIRLAAAAVVQGEEMEEGMQSLDARPLDSNLICPLCKQQFRIGQIQLYRHHVDNCKGV